MFEMCCGYELITCVPRKQEYKTVKDKGLRLTLQYIFEDDFPHSIEQVCTCIAVEDLMLYIDSIQKCTRV